MMKVLLHKTYRKFLKINELKIKISDIKRKFVNHT